MENFERPAELTKIKYDVDDVTYNKIGDWIEKDCNTSVACINGLDREDCGYFRIMIDAILSGRREVEIEGLPSKRKELELEELDFDLLQPRPPLSDNMTDRQKKNMEIQLSSINEKEKFIKACEEKIRNNTFNNFDEDD